MSMPNAKPAGLNRPFVATVVAALCGLFLFEAPIAGLAAVQAHLDRSSVSTGGQITLEIETDSAASGMQPDLAPLNKDFVVLGTSTQTETSIVNGSRSSLQRWSVRLQPRHAGPLQIPPITLGSDHTAALALDVAAPSPQAAAETAQHVFVEVDAPASTRSVYVQQQAPCTVRLYFDDTIQKGELAAPNPTDAVVEQLGDDKRSTAVRNGRSYNVIERTYAISPEKSGTLRIPPVVFNGSQVLPQSAAAQGATPDDADAGDDIFARMLRNTPFANDPLFRRGLMPMPFAQETQPVFAQGKEVDLDVRPRPAGAPGDWLPAEALTLHDSWQDNPPQLKAGEPATRTITIEATGLSASQIPPLALAQPANARLYPEVADNQSRTDGKTIMGISTQKLTYIPNAQGTLDVPAVELAWWDVRADAPRKATLPAMHLGVEPGVAGAATESASPGPAGQPSPAPELTQPASGATHASGWQALLGQRGKLVGAVSLLVLLIVLVFFNRRSRRRGAADVERVSAPSASPAPPGKSVSLNALQRACLADDGHAAARALHELALAQWPDDPPLGLGALASRVEKGAAEIRGLERCLYGAGQPSAWQGDALWQATRRGLSPRRTPAARADDGLMALYPLASTRQGLSSKGS